MLRSLALVFLCGLVLGGLFGKFKIPSLLGMLVAGILLGPYVLNVLDPALLGISADLREIALIIILMRAGLNLNIKDLKRVGRPAILMCFVPASFEILGMLLLAPMFLHITPLEAVIMGTVIAAVSPAVIVPKMLKLIENGYGTQHGIPQMIMAGASVDDVFVIVLFTAFTGLAQGGTITPTQFLSVPTSIAFGLLGGIISGMVVKIVFQKIQLQDSYKVIVLLAISFLLITIERQMTGVIGFSGLLAVMAMGATLQQKAQTISSRLSEKFSKLWCCAEILLFVLVGATVDIGYLSNAGIRAVMLILCVLIFRIIGVFVCLIKTRLNRKERFFCALAYMPKATVQAAIGGIPLALGLSCGDIVLTVAVLAILITAPLGAMLVDATYQRLLDNAC